MIKCSFLVGIIDTTPRKIKEGRRISTKSELNDLDPPKLLEVKDPDAPNVLTNDPNFFNDVKPPKNAGNVSPTHTQIVL